MIEEADYILPAEDGFKNQVLDEYMAAGYYRMVHTIFTTNYTLLGLAGEPVPVFWLRIRVNDIAENKAAGHIRKKAAGFTIAYKKAAITAEIEKLYSLYYDEIGFSTSPTCESCLHDRYNKNPFDSMMIEIRHNFQLIAAGYFDLGKNAIAGILNFYHPAYKKYSPGKLLMLKKIDFARTNKIPWYYTGYLSTAITKFDYKLFPDENAVEVFLPSEKKWVPYKRLGKKGLELYAGQF